MITTQERYLVNLPNKPYATDDFNYGIRPNYKSKAIQKKYIQHNNPWKKVYIVIDVDNPDYMDLIKTYKIPPPNYVVINPENWHAHIIYELKTGVNFIYNNYKAKFKPMLFYANIEETLRQICKGDLSYGGLISKNPFHPHWIKKEFRTDPYEMNEFLDWFDIPLHNMEYFKTKKKSEIYGAGRNCTVFDETRIYAYAMKKHCTSQEELYKHVEDKANNVNNQFTTQLDQNELKHIIKSITKWTWKNYLNKNTSQFEFMVQITHTPQIQSNRGKKSGEARLQKTFEQRLLANMYSMIGFKSNDIAAIMKTSKQNISNWLK